MTTPSSSSLPDLPAPDTSVRWGLIAGNGQFPFLVLEAARSQGIDLAVIAIREEASPELEKIASRLHWVSLGELSRTLELLHQEGITRAVMAGQVKHNKIFSSIRPDWKLAKLLFSLPLKNTDSLIGAVARVLESEGIELVDSTTFLKPLIPAPGVLTKRAPDAREAADIAYGREIARQIAGLDLGQTVVIRDLACVAVEAMEGTDETIERAARLAGGGSLVVVKVSKPRQDMRFDVPVVGVKTVEVMQRCGVSALAMDGGRTLLFDRARVIEAADAAGIAIEAFPLEATGVAEKCGGAACGTPSVTGEAVAGEALIPGLQPGEKVRVAVVGAGDFGRNHARVYREIADAELVGIVDANPERAAQIAKEFSTEVISNMESLAGRVDAASVAVPTVEHARAGCRLLELGIDVLVEKPMAASLDEADALVSTAAREGRILQIGHLERFNPGIIAVMPALNRPLYFEVHRLGVFTPRSLDIDVVYDVMIHDLDILLALVDSPVVEIKAIGIPVLTGKVDIAHARLDFASGAVANVTASRVSTERVRKLRFFQQHEYISVDFTRQDALRVRVVEPGPQPKFDFTTLPAEREEPLRAELRAFLESVRTRRAPMVDGAAGRRALELADRVMAGILEHGRRVQLGDFVTPLASQP